MDRKHCGKRRNCLLQAISPFPTVFSKGLFPRASNGVVVWEWVNTPTSALTETSILYTDGRTDSQAV